MTIRLFTIPGYVHLYRSLLRFRDMGRREARELVYTLNTANLDSFRYAHPRRNLRETGYSEFISRIDRQNRRPYRTEVQLYKSLAALRRNIIREALTAEQREAVATLCYIMSDLEYKFFKAFGFEIYDVLTVYSDCSANLVPEDGEPSVCIVRDWLMLPSA